MARVGGRNLAASWIAGVLCTGVVAGLVWFAIPFTPVLADLIGDTLRQFTPAP